LKTISHGQTDFYLSTIGTPESSTPPTNGNYRFVSNTFVGNSGIKTGLNLWGQINSIQLYNNIFYMPPGQTRTLFRMSTTNGVDAEYYGTPPTFIGSNNWISEGTSLSNMNNVVVENFDNANDPLFTNLAQQDFTLQSSSQCINTALASPPENGFQNPTPANSYPPIKSFITSAAARTAVTDIGAFEYGADISAFHIVRQANWLSNLNHSIPFPFFSYSVSSCASLCFATLHSFSRRYS